MLPARTLVVMLLAVVFAMEQVVRASMRLLHVVVFLLHLCTASLCLDEARLGLRVLNCLPLRCQFITSAVYILVKIIIIRNGCINTANRYYIRIVYGVERLGRLLLFHGTDQSVEMARACLSRVSICCQSKPGPSALLID